MIRVSFRRGVIQSRPYTIAILLGLCGYLCSGTSIASPSEDGPEIAGYVQTWWTIYEQLENGRLQSKTRDEAQQGAHGFSVRRARVSLCSPSRDERIGYKVELKLEGDPALSDCYVSLRIRDDLRVYLGQMKIPSTYEVGTSSTGLDFISRTLLSRSIANWALSSYPSDFGTVTFTGSSSGLRDLGIAIEGGVKGDLLRYFAMAGNGLGANLYIGGKEERQFIRTNGVGELFYGLRVDLRPVPWMTLGGHGTTNIHEDMIVRDVAKGSVIDLHRTSWSADAGVACPGRIGVRGMYAGGAMDEDVLYRDGKKDYTYWGYEGKALWEVLEDELEIGLRFDTYRYEFNESGDCTEQDHWTFGVTYRPNASLKAQVNYVRKETRARDEPDLEDDILFADLQMAF